MADIKTNYGTPSAVTISLASLATDTNQLDGRCSLVVDNTSSKYLDYLVGGKTKTHSTAATAGKTIEVWAYAPIDGASGYPDTMDGTDSNKTITSRDILASALRLVAAMTVDATVSRAYTFAPVSIASLFGGVCPPKWGLFVVQNTGQILSATGGDHAITMQPTYVSAS